MALADNLVRYWKLDETAGTTATDSTGNENGTYTDSYVLNQTGIIGRAVSVDNGYVHYATPPNNPDMSFSIWFKTGNALSRRHFLIGNARNVLSLDNTTQITWFSDAADNQKITATIGTAFNDDAWHHIVVTQAGLSATIYFDGVQVKKSAVAAISTFEAEGRIGEYEGISPEWYLGDIDEVGIWTRELTSNEAIRLYNSGVGLPYPFLLGLSTSVDLNNGPITQAKLTATESEGTGLYSMSADGGNNFENVTNGTLHTFTNTGSNLRWQVEGDGVTITKINITDYH